MSRPQQNIGIYENRQGVGHAPWSETPGTHFLVLLPRLETGESALLSRPGEDVNYFTTSGGTNASGRLPHASWVLQQDVP